jgi:hypothetical protein
MNMTDDNGTLNALSRCDYCPAQAWVRVAKFTDDDVFELQFCGHDYAIFEKALEADEWELSEDERHQLVNAPESSAAAAV